MRARPRSVDRGTCRPGIQPQQTDTRVVRQGPWRGLRVTVICTPYARSGRITAETSARFLATSSRTMSPGRGEATLFEFIPECSRNQCSGFSRLTGRRHRDRPRQGSPGTEGQASPAAPSPAGWARTAAPTGRR